MNTPNALCVAVVEGDPLAEAALSDHMEEFGAVAHAPMVLDILRAVRDNSPEAKEHWLRSMKGLPDSVTECVSLWFEFRSHPRLSGTPGRTNARHAYSNARYWLTERQSDEFDGRLERYRNKDRMLRQALGLPQD